MKLAQSSLAYHACVVQACIFKAGVKMEQQLNGIKSQLCRCSKEIWRQDSNSMCDCAHSIAVPSLAICTKIQTNDCVEEVTDSENQLCNKIVVHAASKKNSRSNKKHVPQRNQVIATRDHVTWFTFLFACYVCQPFCYLSFVNFVFFFLLTLRKSLIWHI